MDLRPSNWVVEKLFFSFQAWRVSRERKRSMDRVLENLFIGDLVDARRSRSSLEDEGIDTVLSLTARPVDSTDIHQPLKDGKNRQERFDKAARTLEDQLNEEKTVLLHCAEGVSRSAAVATAAVSSMREISASEGLQIVREGSGGYGGRPVADPDPEIMENCRSYLDSTP